MKILLKSVLMAFLLTAGFGAAQAQKGGGREEDPAKRAEQMTANMTEKLALNESQVAKVKEINLKHAQKGKAMHDANKAAREANKDGDKQGAKDKNQAARQTLRAEHNEDLRKVLTAEQFKTWEQIQADREAKKGERGKHGKGDCKSDKSKTKKG